MGSPLRMRVDVPKIVPPFILRCFLALAWLAHNTFLRSPGPNNLPKMPPFIVRRRVKCFRIRGSTRREDVCING